jgi:hypothetical protein
LVAVYAICTALGVVALIGWIFFGMAATAWEGKEHIDPELRFGVTGRSVVAGVLGFGLGGMSSSFAGWNTVMAALAAIAGAVIAVAASRYLGVEEDVDGDAA